MNVSGYNLISGTKDWITFDECVLCAEYFVIRMWTCGWTCDGGSGVIWLQRGATSHTALLQKSHFHFLFSQVFLF